MWPAFEQDLNRYRELESQLSDPAVVADRARYTKAAKEHGSLAKRVKPYLEFKELSEEIAQWEALAASDPAMRADAEQELAQVRVRQQALSQKLEDMLLDDPS